VAALSIVEIVGVLGKVEFTASSKLSARSAVRGVWAGEARASDWAGIWMRGRVSWSWVLRRSVCDVPRQGDWPAPAGVL